MKAYARLMQGLKKLQFRHHPHGTKFASLMTAKRRKILIISVVVLALLSTLAMRLNTDKLYTHITEQMKHYPDLHLQAEKTSFTFIHGIGIRLDNIKLDHPSFQAEASHIIITIRLLPLLIGQVKVKELDIHDAIFQLKSDNLPISALTISETPVKYIRFIRSRIIAASGVTLLNNMQLELRGIGSGHEVLWEMSAKQEHQSLSGHGRISFHHGEIESAFSKVKLANLPVNSLQSVAPPALMTWIEGEDNTLSGSLTIDMTKNQTWAVFGELMLANKQTNMHAKLRGKLSHPNDGQLVWKDSFIHLDDKAVIAIAGSCQHSRCTTSLDAKNIELSHWHQFIPASITFHRHLSGLSHLLASLQWGDKTWQSKAKLKLKQLHFLHDEKNISLPDLDIDLYELSGDANTWATQASITSPQATGLLKIHSNRESNGDKNMEMTVASSASQLWSPLANLLLASLNITPSLHAKGPIQGSLHVHQHGHQKKIQLQIDATAAEINYKPWLNKASNITATCKAMFQFSDNKLKAAELSQCQLDSAQLDTLKWTIILQSHALKVKNLSIDLDQLRSHSIALPQYMDSLHGAIQGSGTTRWTTRVHWLNKLYGDWSLRDIGTKSWKINGNIQVQNGIFSSQRLNLHGAYGQAKIQGNYNASKQRGNINILNSTLDWRTMPPPPDWWKSVSLQGEIYQTEFTLFDHNRHHLRSSYKLSQGALTLQNLQSNIADGFLNSDSITLSPNTDGLAIKGSLHIKDIQLQQLHGLNAWIHADLHGVLHANIKLDGQIYHQPVKPWQTTWQRSNGDILIYSGDWQQHHQGEMQVPPPYAFKKLDFRFRIGNKNTTISNIHLLSHDQHYQGRLNINADFQLNGTIQHNDNSDSYLINSPLPQIHWKTQ